jgi:hypothetical protein
VQVVRLDWTKAARGGEGARARTAVPAASEVSAADLIGAGGVLCVDASHWGDRNAFAEPFRSDRRRVPLADGFVVGCVTVSVSAAGLQVGYRYEPATGGAPDRRAFAPAGHRESTTRTLLARDGEWVRVCYNGRFSDFDFGDWYYQQVTVNVAWFAGEPDRRVFLDREPAQELRALAELW